MTTINGEASAIDSGNTLSEILAQLGLPPERVAIELNRQIVKRELWSETQAGVDAQIEIVQFVGGG